MKRSALVPERLGGLVVPSAQPLTPIRCIWHTRLVIEPQQVPSGTRYDFQPGQVQGVQAIDAETLLAKQHVQTACCGATVSPVIKMFEKA